MTFLLLMAFLLPLGAGLSLWTKNRAELCFFPALCGLIALAYLCALAGVLGAAVPLALLTWLAALGFTARCLHKRRAAAGALARQLLPFAALCALYWWLCRGCAFTAWDDFSHWGRAAKILYHTGGLYTAPGAGTDFQSYPPATALLQYLFLRLRPGAFREDVCLFAGASLAAAALTMPLGHLPAGKPAARWGLWAALALLPAALYPQWLYQLGVDGLLGLVLAAVLMAGAGEAREGRRAAALTGVLGCFVLTLVKSTGFSLALPAGALLLTEGLRRGREEPTVRRLAAAAGPLLAALAAWGTWRAHLALQGVGERWQSGGPLPAALGAFLRGEGPAYRRAVWAEFWRQLLGDRNYGGPFRFPFLGWCVLFCLLCAAAIALTPSPGRGPVARRALAALAIGWAFVLGLAASYLFFFTEGEARALASLSRYLTTCVALWMAVGMALLGKALAGLPAPRHRAALALALLWCLAADAPALARPLWQAPLHAAETQNSRATLRHGAARIASLGQARPRLYLITGNDAGSAQMQLDYELYPVRLPVHSAILMTEGGESLPWVKHCTWRQWAKELAEGYEYVYLYCVEDQFVAEFLPVFEDEADAVGDTLLQVVPAADGGARLRRMG